MFSGDIDSHPTFVRFNALSVRRCLVRFQWDILAAPFGASIAGRLDKNPDDQSCLSSSAVLDLIHWSTRSLKCFSRCIADTPAASSWEAKAVASEQGRPVQSRCAGLPQARCPHLAFNRQTGMTANPREHATLCAATACRCQGLVLHAAAFFSGCKRYWSRIHSPRYQQRCIEAPPRVTRPLLAIIT